MLCGVPHAIFHGRILASLLLNWNSNREGDIEALTFQSKPNVAIVIMVCRFL